MISLKKIQVRLSLQFDLLMHFIFKNTCMYQTKYIPGFLLDSVIHTPVGSPFYRLISSSKTRARCITRENQEASRRGCKPVQYYQGSYIQLH